MAAPPGPPVGARRRGARPWGSVVPVDGIRLLRRLVLVLVLVLVLALGSVAAAEVPALAPRQAPTPPRSTPVPAGQRLPEPQPSAEESRQEASSVLSGAEYQEPPKSFLESIGEWFQEQIGRLLSNTGSFWSGFAYIILALLVGAVLLLLVRLRGTARVRGAGAGYEFDLEDRRPPIEWIADAERFEARGEWKQALRCRFRALVGELIDMGALRDLPGRTTGEYRLEMRRFAPSAGDAFDAATELFERAWYGDEATGPQESGRFRDLAQQSVSGARAARGRVDDDVSVPA